MLTMSNRLAVEDFKLLLHGNKPIQTRTYRIRIGHTVCARPGRGWRNMVEVTVTGTGTGTVTLDSECDCGCGLFPQP